MRFSISVSKAVSPLTEIAFNCSTVLMRMLPKGPSRLDMRSGLTYFSWKTRVSSSARILAVAANSSKMASFFISISSLIDEPDNHDIGIVGQHLHNQLWDRTP